MERARLRVVKHKVREGAIDRVVDGTTLIGRDLFSKGTDMALFVGKKVELEDGSQGVIEGAFGQGGKFKAVFPGGLPIVGGAGGSAGAASAPDSAAAVAAAKKSKAKVGTLKGKIYLRFKKYMYALDKKAIVQTITTTKQTSASSALSASASQPAAAAASAAAAGSS